MMSADNKIAEEYFDWMYEMMHRGSPLISWRKLMRKLHSIEFKPKNSSDKARASDGVTLRYRYALVRDDRSIEDHLTGPCSVLEMMVALAIRCEETIMDDPKYGDRTASWFWSMVVNMGLGGMYDDRYDDDYADFVVTRFLKRKYDPDGKGGLYRVRGFKGDMRKMDIWSQMNAWLNTFD